MTTDCLSSIQLHLFTLLRDTGTTLDNSKSTVRIAKDIRTPEELEVHTELGEFLVRIKKDGKLHDYVCKSPV